jgi:hypothetical protein
MANFIIKKTDRDHREAAHKAGLSGRRYSGLARSEEEAHDVMRRRGGNDRPDDVLAFEDGGQSDREQMKRAGVPEEHIERRKKK